MSGKRKLLYYKLTPIFEPEPGAFVIESAAVQTCHATGEVLSGMGGGGKALAPHVVDALDITKNEGQPMIVCKAALYDTLVETLKGVVTEIASPEGVTAHTIDAITGVLDWAEREEDAG